MIFIVGSVGVIVLVLLLSSRRRVVRERKLRYSHQAHSTRIFKPESDPFNSSERIEIYHHSD